MATKRILLLGAGGQIGQALRAQPQPVDWYLKPFTHAECDIADHRATQNAIQTVKPDLVVNAAAITSVDQCETDHDLARRVNFDGPASLASQCGVADIPLIHISTDYVFDGKTDAPYKPDDAVNPINAYGESKMLGEEAIRHELAWHVVLRTASVFGIFGNNLLTRMLQSIDTQDEIKAPADQISSPTAAHDVAHAIVTIGEAILKGKVNGFGTFHFAGNPPATRLEFTQAIMDAYAPYTKKRPGILPIKSAELSGRAPRPLHTVLDCAKIRDIYGIEAQPWREGLAEAMNELMRDRMKVA